MIAGTRNTAEPSTASRVCRWNTCAPASIDPSTNRSSRLIRSRRTDGFVDAPADVDCG